MPVLRLFAAAREAAGEARIELEGRTVGDVLDQARARYGEGFASVLQRSRVWLNGQPADPATVLGAHDVVAVLPPVSGGAGASAGTSTAGPSAAPVTTPPPPPPPRPSLPDAGAEPEFDLSPADLAPPPSPPPPPLLEEEAAPLVSDPLSPLAPSPSPELAAEQRLTDPWGPWPQGGDQGRYPTPDLGPVAGRREEPAAPLPPPPPPPPGSSSPDDLLDRLAGLPPFSGDPLFGEPDEPAEEEGLTSAPEPDLDTDLAGWGPASGPVWSLGEQPPPPPPPGGDPDLQPAEGEPDLWKWPDAPLTPAEAGEAPAAPPDTASPFAPPPLPGTEWDRRWDEPLREPKPEEGDEGPSASLRPISPPGAVSAGAEPAVRILRPAEDDGGPPTAPVQIFDQPAVRILGRETPKDSPEPGSSSAAPQAVGVLDAPPVPHPSSNGAGAATAAAPAPAPAPEKARRKAPPLAVVVTANRPHGRLGLLWVGVTVAAVVTGPVPAAVWLAACATVAGLQTAKVWRSRNEKPLQPLAAAIAGVLPLSAVWGLRAMTAVLAAAVVLALLARLFSLTKAPARDVGLTLAIGVVIGLAVASVVLLRNIDVHAPLLLLAFAAAYDAGAYLVGTGASSAWEGPAAGVATLIPVTMLSAVILVPPFGGGGPLLLGLVAAILAPCGPLAGSALLGERDANAPALRRLDSLLVLAPVWAWCAAALLR